MLSDNVWICAKNTGVSRILRLHPPENFYRFLKHYPLLYITYLHINYQIGSLHPNKICTNRTTSKKVKFMNKISLLFVIMIGCIKLSYANTVAPITDFNSKQYLGTWYEIARLPNRFENKCTVPINANYSINPDNQNQLIVVNQWLMQKLLPPFDQLFYGMSIS